MRALSIHQPWAWAILHAGKNVENRTWRINHRGPLLIHASKSRRSYDRLDANAWERRFGVILPPWEELVKGAIVGIVEVVDCVRTVGTRVGCNQVPGLGECLWAEPDAWCWVLTNPRACAVPVPFGGKQLLFEVPDELVTDALRLTCGSSS
jgi:hypothetical protein